MGDPTSPLWGAAYYNGVKLDSEPAPDIMALIQAAADAAGRIYDPIVSIRTSTNPDMVAVLLDPEWINLQGTGAPIVWDSLSPELQDKIRRVPNLYNSLIGNLAALTPPLITPVPTGPARYVQGGIEFLSDGTVISYNGAAVPTGTMLTPAEVSSLLNSGALPTGDSGPAMTAQQKVTQTPLPPNPTNPIPYTYTAPPAVSPSPSLPLLVNTFATGNDAGPASSGGGGSFDVGGTGGSSAVPAPSSSSALPRWVVIAGGIAAVLGIMHIGQPSRRTRRRRR
jgi:hypothetical protein